MQLAGHDPAQLLNEGDRAGHGRGPVGRRCAARPPRPDRARLLFAMTAIVHYTGRGKFLGCQRPRTRAGPGVAELARQAAAAADERGHALGEQAAADPPDWAIDLFGAVPDEPARAAAVDRRSGGGRLYRELTGHDDAEQGIGEPPAR